MKVLCKFMEEQTPEPKRPERPLLERRTPPLGGNIVWYLILLGVGTLFFVNYMTTDSLVEIPYMDLWKLIEQGAPQINNQAAVKVNGEGSKAKEVYRYSNLDNLHIGPQEITGTVTKEIVQPQQQRTAPEDNVTFHTARLGLENDNNALFQLLKQKGFINVRAEKAPSGWHNLVPMFLFMILIVGLFIFMMRRLGGAGSAIAFGRSRGKLYAQEDIGITFNDVAGIDEAVDELREVVDFLKSPEKYQVLGGRIPKGVLLVGPPGTGKTLLAKAIAGEAGVPFFSLSGSDFVEMFVGVGAARVRDMFQQAQAKAPCIVFIDELDALGKTRGTSIVGGHDEREQTLNALLVEMDGFSSNSGVIIMAATNRPETLDPALLRPGRFDRHVLVDRPDVRGREAILKVHVSKVKLDPSVDLKEVAKITPGLVGADLANLVNEAALLAARANKTAVTMAEFNEGVERVIAGLEKRQRVMHADEKQRVAYHESGHALVAYSLPNTDPVHKVSIIPRGLGMLGYTMHRPEGDRYLQTQSELESQIQVLLAGTVAEEMIYNDVSTGAERPGTGHRNRPQHGYGLRHEPLGPDHLSREPPLAVFDGDGRYRPRPQSQRTDRAGNRRGNPQDRQPVAGKSPPRAGNPPPGTGGHGRTPDRERNHRHRGIERTRRIELAQPHDRARHGRNAETPAPEETPLPETKVNP